MRSAAPIAALFAAAALTACGSDAPETAAEVKEARADALREAADASNPAGAAQLENLADQHERAAEALDARDGTAPGNAAAVTAPIPDNVSVGNAQGQ